MKNNSKKLLRTLGKFVNAYNEYLKKSNGNLDFHKEIQSILNKTKSVLIDKKGK